MTITALFSSVLLFAEEQVPASTQGWVALIVQTGAIGILGWHLLFGLPKMAKEQQESLERMLTKVSDANERSVASVVTLFRSTLAEDRQIDANRSNEDRKESMARNQALVNEMVHLRDSVPRDVGAKLEHVVTSLENLTGAANIQVTQIEKQTEVLEAQSAGIEKQTAMLGHVAKKMEDWPSDANKLCKAEAAVRKAFEDMGVDERTITKLLEVKRRQRERDAKKQEGK